MAKRKAQAKKTTQSGRTYGMVTATFDRAEDKDRLKDMQATAKKTEVNVHLPLLKDVMSVQSNSRGKDTMMLEFLFRTINGWVGEFAKLGIELVVEDDEYGNIYATKGKPSEGGFYPCAVSHVDTVHWILSDFTVFVERNVMFAMNMNRGRQVGIGGDDKVGVYICLEYLRRLPACKVAFFRDEEIGTIGSRKADMTFFEDVAFVLQADRNGYGDFVDNIGGTPLGSSEWYTALAPILKTYGYQRHMGALTDVVTLKENGLKVSCANASCGYINPHTDSEIVLVPVVANTLSMFLSIADSMSGQQWTHEHKRPDLGKYVYGAGWRSWDDDEPYVSPASDGYSPGPWSPPVDKSTYVNGWSIYDRHKSGGWEYRSRIRDRQHAESLLASGVVAFSRTVDEIVAQLERAKAQVAKKKEDAAKTETGGGQKALPPGAVVGVNGQGVQGLLPGVVDPSTATSSVTEEQFASAIMLPDGSLVLTGQPNIGSADEGLDDDEETDIVEAPLDEDEAREYTFYLEAAQKAINGDMNMVRSTISSGTTHGTEDWCESCGASVKVFTRGYWCGGCDKFYLAPEVYDFLNAHPS